ncbi:MAG: hypothetical protein M3N52_13845 [Actinomycetota bacterium]|nr:hypothetical protein [Actinomycetota bacterium]
MDIQAPEGRSDPPRAALLVFHGMGSQNRFSTLDGFARGLIRAAGSTVASVDHELQPLDETLGPAVRLRLSSGLPRSGATALDLFELYWAPLAQRRIKLPAVLAWLARTSLTPLRNWATQPDLRDQAGPGGARTWWLLCRELLRGVYLPILFVVLISPFVLAAASEGDFRALGSRIAQAAPRGFWPLVDTVAPLALFALGLFLAWVALRLLVRRTSARQLIEQRTNGLWLASSAVAAGIAWAAGLLVELGWQRRATAFLAAVGPQLSLRTVGTLALAAVAWLLRGWLVAAIGDVPLYVTADENSELYSARAAILERGRDALRRLLESGGYDTVYVAGHSLGSVIAYDTINHLERERRMGLLADEAYQRLRGFTSFGSPLDKVDYFFRVRVGPEEAVRAQLLASLHGFRRRTTGRDYGPYEFAPYQLVYPSPFWWLNVWSSMDPVSGRLDRYRVEEQIHRRYLPWFGLAHTRYWRDARFYDQLYARL